MLRRVATAGAVSLDNRREFFPTIANNATDAEHDLDIGAARVWVSDGTTEKLVDFTAATKRIDAVWAAGTNQGGLDTGTVANSTWYYTYAIYNPTTDATDYLISASATAPTMPSGYTYKRRVRVAITDGSANLLAFIQVGKRYFLREEITEINTTSPPDVWTDLTLSLPDIKCDAMIRALVRTTSNSDTQILYLFPYIDSTPTVSSTHFYVRGDESSANAYTSASMEIPLINRKIKYRARTSLATNVILYTGGFVDYEE